MTNNIGDAQGAGSGSMPMLGMAAGARRQVPARAQWRLGSEKSPLRVLVVDNDRRLTYSVTRALNYAGCAVDIAHSGDLALTIFRAYYSDIVILDVQLPEIDGYEINRQIQELRPTPVVLLIASDLLKQHADKSSVSEESYLAKPFKMDELIARLSRLSKHLPNQAIQGPEYISAGNLVLETRGRVAIRGGVSIPLTVTEFKLLRYLMSRADMAVRRSEILDAVWGHDFGGRTNVVDLYISYLRRKIHFEGSPMIHTVRSFGYVLRTNA